MNENESMGRLTQEDVDRMIQEEKMRAEWNDIIKERNKQTVDLIRSYILQALEEKAGLHLGQCYLSINDTVRPPVDQKQFLDLWTDTINKMKDEQIQSQKNDI